MNDHDPLDTEPQKPPASVKPLLSQAFPRFTVRTEDGAQMCALRYAFLDVRASASARRQAARNQNVVDRATETAAAAVSEGIASWVNTNPKIPTEQYVPNAARSSFVTAVD
jgi:hypothetical protein